MFELNSAVRDEDNATPGGELGPAGIAAVQTPARALFLNEGTLG